MYLSDSIGLRTLVCTLTLVGFTCCCRSTVSAETLIKNGNFEAWENDTPLHWQVSIGASNGAKQPLSKIKPIPGSGIMLQGDLQTRAWRAVSQVVPVEPGKSYRLQFFARGNGVIRQGNQFDNCYVGLLSRDAREKVIGRAIQDVSDTSDVWKSIEVNYVVPAADNETTLMLFLSKSGALEIKDVSLLETEPADPFKTLIDAMASRYSFTEMKRIDWKVLQKEYGKAARKVESTDQFVAAIKPMLSGLKDPHVWIEDADGRRWSSHWSMFQPNVEPQVLQSKVQDIQEFGSIGWTGRYETFGVIVINSLPTSGDYEALLQSVDAMRDLEGIIVDLRYNKGGNENRAASIAGRFVNTPTTYARNQVMRDGSLVETPPRVLQPSSTKPIRVPVVCLIGPGCISSGEGFALMMKAIEGVTVIGQPTRGASGNPKPVELPGGIKVWFSRWVALEMDGTSIEGRGVQPDEIVSHQRGSDRTFERAVEILKSRATEK